MNFIYIIKLYNQHKIGSTKHPINRIQQYKTSYFSENNNKLTYIKLYNIFENNCYEIDELLKRDTNRGFERFYELDNFNNVGTEFYNLNCTKQLEKWFDINNIEFEEYDINKCVRVPIKKFLKEEHCKYKIYLREENKIKNVGINPREYQFNTYDKMCAHYKQHNNGKLIWPCGIGKTFMCLLFIKQQMNKYRKILIGVPSIILIKQFVKTIEKIFNETEYLISDQHINTSKILFIITTYHSCYKFLNFKFDLVIGDECHHLVQKEDKTSGFIKFHDIWGRKKLYMTATEKFKDDEKYSMDCEETFGKTIDEKSTKWAIDSNYITDYNVIIIKNSKEFINKLIDKFEICHDDTKLFLSAYLTLQSLQQFSDLSHILIYTNSTSNADKVNKYISKLINISQIQKEEVYYNSLHSNKDFDLSYEINKFNISKFGIISCVHIFGEGFDLPSINGIIIAENMTSEIRIVQYCLRANRLLKSNPNKKAYYMIPYCHSFKNCNSAGDEFQNVRHIISRLKNVDENIYQKIETWNCWDYLFEKFKTKEESLIKFKRNPFDPLELEIKKSIELCQITEQLEYDHLQNKFRNIPDLKTKTDPRVKKIISEHKLKYSEIEKYFGSSGVWKNWYDFLVISCANYPMNVKTWKEKSAQNLTSIRDYINFAQKSSDLPVMADEYFNKVLGVENFSLSSYLRKKRRR